MNSNLRGSDPAIGEFINWLVESEGSRVFRPLSSDQTLLGLFLSDMTRPQAAQNGDSGKHILGKPDSSPEWVAVIREVEGETAKTVPFNVAAPTGSYIGFRIEEVRNEILKRLQAYF